MPGRAHAIAVHRYPADVGDLAGDLRFRQKAADTGLGPLAEFDFDRADLRRTCDGLLQTRHAEAPVWFTAAEVTGPDLPDQIAAIQMMRRHTAFTSALQTSGDAA